MIRLIIALCITYVIASTNALASERAMLVVISHQQTNAVTLDDVVAFYTLKKKLLTNSRKAVLLVHPLNSQMSIRFFRDLFDSYPYQFKRIWDVGVFSGRAKRPVMLKSNTDVMAYINKNKDAIGYVLIKAEELATIRENFHVIATYP